MEEKPTILVPIEVLEGESIPEGVPALLANAHVVLLGYHVLPDQTSTDQARAQFEDQALTRLDEYASLLEDAGAAVDSRLVFTHDSQQTMDRVIAEHDCLAVLLPNAISSLDEILVAVRGVVGIDRFVRLLTGLFASTEVSITLYHITAADETDEDAKTLLDGIRSRIGEEGIDSDSIEFRIERKDDAQTALQEAATDFDVVVMGESDPSVKTFVFGMPAEQIAKRYLGPVLVVQREKHDETDEEADE